MNLPGKRLLLGSAVAVATLGVGGIAYAATNDPAPDTGYVTIEDGATPSPGYGSNSGPQGNGSEGSGTPNSGTTGRNGADCPDKNGTGQGEGQGQGQGQQTQPSQPETQPSQPQTEPSQPEQSQPDQAENA